MLPYSQFAALQLARSSAGQILPRQPTCTAADVQEPQRETRPDVPLKSPLRSPEYNFGGMGPLRHALVAYVKAPMAEFVEQLRRELHPGLPHLPAHITILPPRLLRTSEAEARRFVEEICLQASPFEVTLGEVGTFVPVTPTLLLRVARGAYRIRELHDRLNSSGLEWNEEWLFMPHLTVAKMANDAEAITAMEIASRLWSEFRGSRRVLVNELTFVREASGNTWEDLAPMPLGGELVTR